LARFAGGLPAASVGAALEAGGGWHRAGYHLCGGRLPVQPAPRRSLPSTSEIALLLLAAGALARLGWLAAGFWKLRQYRRHSSRSNRRLPGASRPTCGFPATWPAR